MMVGSKEEWDTYNQKRFNREALEVSHEEAVESLVNDTHDYVPSETPDAPWVRQGKTREVDPNVTLVTGKYHTRAQQGFLKYGVDTTRDDLSTEEWLVHLQEELMDATVYIERLLGEIRTLKKTL